MTNTPIEVECRTADEAHAAIQAGNVPLLMADMRIEISANVRVKCMAGIATLIALGASQPSIEARGSSKPSIVAWGSSQPSIVARGSSQPSIEARESSQPSIVARESSQPSIVARESSQPSIVAWGSSQPSIEARESSQPSIEARESSKPSIVARESSKPSIVARESSQPSIVARESSKPSIVAWESSKPSIVASGVCQVSARGSVNIKAGNQVAIAVLSGSPTIEGGGYVVRLDISTPEKWCEYYGVEVVDGHAILFKVVNADYKANYNGFQYLPGTTQRAPDWDPDPTRECGGGLHFCPSPRHAQRFYPGAENFIGLKVALATLLVHPDGESPDKCRGPETLECFDVDIDGKRIEPRKAAAE